MPTLTCPVRLCSQPGWQYFVFGFLRSLLDRSSLLRNTIPNLGLLGWYGDRPPAGGLGLGRSRSSPLFPLWRQLVQVVRLLTKMKYRKSSQVELTIPLAISSESRSLLLFCAFPSIYASLESSWYTDETYRAFARASTPLLSLASTFSLSFCKP